MEFFGDFWAVRECPGIDMGCYVGIYALNSMLVCMRPGIAMEIGFKNWNRCRMSGLPVDSPLPLFWGLNWGVYMVIYGINYASVFKRPEMGKKFGSKE